MIIFDHRQTSFSHLKANALIIYNVCSENQNEMVHLFFDEGYIENIKKFFENRNINLSNIIYHPFKIPYDVSKREYFRFYEIGILKNIIDFAVKNNETKLLSLYTSVFQLYTIKLYAYKYKQLRIFSMLHGELETIDFPFSVHKLLKYLYHLFLGIRLPMLMPTPSNLKFIALGESIRKNLINIYPRLEKSVISMEHINSFYFNDYDHYVPFKDNKIIFGVLGVILRYKNGENLLKLFDKLNQQENKNFEIHVIGHVRTTELYEQFKSYDFVKLYSEPDKFLDEEVLEKETQNIDYAICCFNGDNFRMVASGTFWDSMTHYKPFIALSCDYFKYYFEKAGNIGFLIEDFSTWENEIINIILKQNKEKYYNNVENIKSLKSNSCTYGKIFNTFN